ncbi:hypothetical protein ERO13_A02G036503v2 [Gossypium hirsutum]|nr:hypothetical protein ERO13_A02G036503v2 [Gossypium hirsutum]
MGAHLPIFSSFPLLGFQSLACAEIKRSKIGFQSFSARAKELAHPSSCSVVRTPMMAAGKKSMVLLSVCSCPCYCSITVSASVMAATFVSFLLSLQALKKVMGWNKGVKPRDEARVVRPRRSSGNS